MSSDIGLNNELIDTSHEDTPGANSEAEKLAQKLARIWKACQDPNTFYDALGPDELVEATAKRMLGHVYDVIEHQTHGYHEHGYKKYQNNMREIAANIVVFIEMSIEKTEALNEMDGYQVETEDNE